MSVDAFLYQDEIADRYRIEYHIDSGCTSQAYQAWSFARGELVCFKTMRIEKGVVHGRWSDSYGKRPFDCPILDSGAFSDGRRWYVQPLGVEATYDQYQQVMDEIGKTDLMTIDNGPRQWVYLSHEARVVLIDYNCHVSPDELPKGFQRRMKAFQARLAACMGNREAMQDVRWSFRKAWRKTMRRSPTLEIYVDLYSTPVDRLCKDHSWRSTEPLKMTGGQP